MWGSQPKTIMADQIIIDTYTLWFQKIANYGLYNPTEQDLIDWLNDLVTINIGGKADKVTGAVANNFAGLDVNGNLLDLGVNVNDFMRTGRNWDDRYYLKSEVNTLLLGKLSNITSESSIENIVLTSPDGQTLYDSGVSIVNVALNSTLTNYYTISQVNAITDLLLPKPIEAYTTGEILAYNSAGETVGTTGVDFTTLITTAIIANYYTITQADALLAGKLNTPPTPLPVNGNVATWQSSQVTDSGTALTGLALVTDLNNKADKVSSATLNNFASLNASGNLLDSGYAVGNFLLLSNLTNFSLNPGFVTAQVGSGNYCIGTAGTTGAGVTPNGTLTVTDNNGGTWYLLKSATA